MFTLQNISKKFNDQLVLDNISLDIKPGEVVAIMGASGSGKTTLLRALIGLISIDTGSITYNGETKYSKSLVAQSSSLLPWLTVGQNIAYGLHLKGLPTGDCDLKVQQYLKAVQMTDYKDFLPKDISGGMKQRASLAASLVLNPDVLFMDEPLSALDTQTKSNVRDFMHSLLVTEKQTTMMVTHDPEEALFLADRIIILSPKSAHIIDDIMVPFSRNRSRSLIYDEKFQDLKKYISYIMYAESIRIMTDNHDVSKKNLTIGSNIWLGVLPLYFGRVENIFQKHKIDAVNLLTFEWASHNRAMPINEGLVDILNMTLETAMVACENNPDLRIIMPIDVSYGGDAIVVNEEISHVSDLIGKRIGVERDWVGDFYLNHVLRLHKIPLDSVTRSYMPSRDTPRALLSDQVDAVVTQEPWLSEISTLRQFNVISDTREHAVIYSVLVTTQELIDKKPDIIKNTIAAIQESLALTIGDPKESIKKTSHIFGMSDVHMEHLLKHLRFINKNNYQQIKKDVSVIEETLLYSGTLNKPFDRSKLLF